MNNPSSEVHPLAPFLPDGARVLMLGSFPPKRVRWSMEFFYPNLQNDMWRIMGLLFFGDKAHFLAQAVRPRTHHGFLPDGRVGALRYGQRSRPPSGQRLGQLPASRATDRRVRSAGSPARMPGRRDDGREGDRNIGGATQVPASCCRRFRTVRIRRPPDAALPYAVVVARLSPVRGMEGGVLPEDVRCGRYDLTFCLRFRLGCSVRVKQNWK